MARPAGFEPTTSGFGGQHSIQLSYGRFVEGAQSKRLLATTQANRQIINTVMARFSTRFAVSWCAGLHAVGRQSTRCWQAGVSASRADGYTRAPS